MAEKNNRRFYWLKLKEDFFKNLRMKKLRKIAGGDTYTIIYLKMQLLSLQNEGKLYFENVELTFEEEIALQIDEEVDDVRIAINFLLSNGLLLETENTAYELPETIACIGSETASTIRSRKSRELKSNQLLLQCNASATNCNGEIDIEIDKDIDNIKKENIKEKKETGKSKSNFDKIIEEENFTEETVERLNDFIKMRKTIKKPLTDRALKLAINKLKKISSSEEEMQIILDRSILNSWQDVYELKDEEKKKIGKQKEETYEVLNMSEEEYWKQHEGEKIYE